MTSTDLHDGEHLYKIVVALLHVLPLLIDFLQKRQKLFGMQVKLLDHI